MSSARLIGLALAAALVALPTMASEETPLRGNSDADQIRDTETQDEAPSILPKVIVTERSVQAPLVSKPAVMRYAPQTVSPVRYVAEHIGQDPDRLPRLAPHNDSSQ